MARHGETVEGGRVDPPRTMQGGGESGQAILSHSCVFFYSLLKHFTVALALAIPIPAGVLELAPLQGVARPPTPGPFREWGIIVSHIRLLWISMCLSLLPQLIIRATDSHPRRAIIITIAD